MDIMFEIVSRQKFSATFSTSHVFGEAGGYIGRAEECEWVLPDRSRQISRQHALVTFEDGHFFLEDVSSNGVFLSLGREALGKNKRHRIEHGEGFTIGDYTLMARLLHDPGAYVVGGMGVQDVSAFSSRLSLNPLEAMEQEAEMNVRARVDAFDDLLQPPRRATTITADHNDPRISRLQPIVAVNASEEIIPEDWDADPGEGMGPSAVAPPTSPARDSLAAEVEEQAQAPLVAPPPTVQEDSCAAEDTAEFFRLLGFAAPPQSPEERRRVLALVAQLLRASVDGMSHALRDRAFCKGELRLPTTSVGLPLNNNPLKFSPTSEAALACLLGPPQKGVLLPLSAVREAFNDVHSHHMGLLAGARAAVSALLEKLSPAAVEAKLDMDGPVRLGRAHRLWHAFVRMHRVLCNDQQDFSGLMLHDFARAYEMQGRTLHPHGTPSIKGESA